METWAHGQDVADTLGIGAPADRRLRHVAHLGVRTPAATATRSTACPVPDAPVRVELDGARRRRSGPGGRPTPPTGSPAPALDFCLRGHPAAAPRRHRAASHRAGRRASGSTSPRPSPGRPGARAARRQGRARHERAAPRPAGRSGSPTAPASTATALAAAREMVEGGPIDVLTGDYLAELTMLILWKARQKDPAPGYAAHVPDPDGAGARHLPRPRHQDRHQRRRAQPGRAWPTSSATLAAPARPGAARSPTSRATTCSTALGELQAAGVDLAHLDTGQPLADAGVQPVTANAYLGGWGIAAALDAGADIVVCPRVTDASLVVGPAAWWHGWAPRRLGRAGRRGASPATSSSAARRPPAATTPSSTRSPTAATRASRSPRSPPTAAA